MKQLLKNLSGVYAVNVLNGVLGILVVPVAVHQLGIGGYGVFSIYALLAGYIALVDLGIGKNLTRLLARDKDVDLQRGHIRSALGFYLVISVLLVLLSPLIIAFVTNIAFPTEGYSFAVATITALAIGEYFLALPIALTKAYCVAGERFKQFSTFNLISGLSRYAVLFVGVLIFSRPELVVALLVGRRALDLALAFQLMGGLPAGSWRPRFDLDALVAVVRQSSILSLAQIIQLTLIALGPALLSRHFGVEALGLFRAAFDLANKIWFFSNGIGLVLFPRFVSMLANAAQRLHLLTSLPSVLLTSWITYMFLSAVGIWISPLVLSVLHLPHAGILPMLVILILGLCMNAHSNLSFELLQATGKYYLTLATSLLALGLMLGTFYLLEGALGPLALAWGWVVSQLAYSLASDAMSLFQDEGNILAKGLTLVSYLPTFALTLLCLLIALQGTLTTLIPMGAGILLFLFIVAYRRMRLRLSPSPRVST